MHGFLVVSYPPATGRLIQLKAAFPENDASMAWGYPGRIPRSLPSPSREERITHDHAQGIAATTPRVAYREPGIHEAQARSHLRGSIG
jgi:hypothetical protein